MTPDPYRESAALMRSANEELARRMLDSRLEPGERLVWAGRPGLGVRLSSADAVLIPFSLVWGGFAIFWEVLALIGAPFFFALWGLPFVLVGQYLIWGRFLVDACRRAHTFYGLTESRVLILVQGRASKLTSLALRAQTDIELDEGRNGRGTIHLTGRRTILLGRTRTDRPALEHIENARAVFDQLCALQQERPAG
jgi:hypothetical protein